MGFDGLATFTSPTTETEGAIVLSTTFNKYLLLILLIRKSF